MTKSKYVTYIYVGRLINNRRVAEKNIEPKPNIYANRPSHHLTANKSSILATDSARFISTNFSSQQHFSRVNKYLSSSRINQKGWPKSKSNEKRKLYQKHVGGFCCCCCCND